LELLVQGAALLNQAGDLGALPLGLRPSIEQLALSRWVTEALLVMLAVNINEWADLAGEAADRHQLVVDAGNGSPFGVHLTNCDLVAALRGDLEIYAEAVRSGAHRS
jgi:predicted dinucleotide-binding enzyme